MREDDVLCEHDSQTMGALPLRGNLCENSRPTVVQGSVVAQLHREIGWCVDVPLVRGYDGGDIPPYDTLPRNTLVIFDDLMLESGDTLREVGKYFCLGRHRHLHCLFLAQNYARIDRQLIRGNCNCVVTFTQLPEKYRRAVYEDFGEWPSPSSSEGAQSSSVIIKQQ